MSGRQFPTWGPVPAGRSALGSLAPAPQLGKPRRAPALMWRVPPPTPRAGPKGSGRPRGPRREGGKVAGSPTTQPALSRYQAGRGPRPPAGLRSGCGGACHRAPSPSPPVTPSRPPAARARSPLGRPLTRASLPSPLPDGASVTSPTCASRQRMGSGSGLWAGPGRAFWPRPPPWPRPPRKPARVRQRPAGTAGPGSSYLN